MKNIPLGDRMKGYENVYRNKLPKKTNTIIRLDGKAFHTYNRGMGKPYDQYFMDAMDEAAKYVVSNISGAKFAYIQSDEISIVLTDYDDEKTQSYFDGNIQKIVSVAASLCTTAFNKIMWKKYPNKDAHFDARVFHIDSQIEVYNYFLFRQRDCQRNSKLSFGQFYLSKKKCHGLRTDKLIEKVYQETGHSWQWLSDGEKNGRVIYNEKYSKGFSIRKRWVIKEAEQFTPSYIIKHLPYKTQSVRDLERLLGFEIRNLNDLSASIQSNDKLQIQPNNDDVIVFKDTETLTKYHVYFSDILNKIIVEEYKIDAWQNEWMNLLPK